MKVPTSLTIFYQEHRDMSFYVNDLLYSLMGWLEEREQALNSLANADEPFNGVLKFFSKNDFIDHLNKKDTSNSTGHFHTSPSSGGIWAPRPHKNKNVNFYHPNNYHNILRTVANYYTTNKYEVAIIDIGGKVCGIDPENPHKSVKLSRRILSLETTSNNNNDLELKVVYQTVIDYNADVLILSNLDHDNREWFLNRLKMNFSSIYNRMIVFHE